MMRDYMGKPVKALMVWEPVLSSDWSTPSTAALRRADDPRVIQFWDRHRLLSHALGEHDHASIVWDQIAVYPAGAAWGSEPPKPIFAGRTVVKVIEQARRAVGSALKE